MSSVRLPQAPSSSLPAIRRISNLSERGLLAALNNLSAIYCPLPVISLCSQTHATKFVSSITTSPIDSGYTSETEDDFDPINAEEKLSILRTDEFERSFSERWLTGLIARADELSCFDSEESHQHVLDLAYCVLESLHYPPSEEEDKSQADFGRAFSFETSQSPSHHEKLNFTIHLNDGLAGMNDTDPDDVGLQSWGASIVFSKLLCESTERFGLAESTCGTSQRIIELGAGTGLVSLVLGKLLPRLAASSITATDYHPAVLGNLRSNIATNFPNDPQAVEAAFLDWSSPTLEPPFNTPADILVATDAVYGLEHAVWLRNCASRLLAPDGIFWLLLTVRQNGKFEKIAKSVEVAFPTAASETRRGERCLAILDAQMVPKCANVGRADESGYKLYKIGWA